MTGCNKTVVPGDKINIIEFVKQYIVVHHQMLVNKIYLTNGETINASL